MVPLLLTTVLIFWAGYAMFAALETLICVELIISVTIVPSSNWLPLLTFIPTHIPRVEGSVITSIPWDTLQFLTDISQFLAAAIHKFIVYLYISTAEASTVVSLKYSVAAWCEALLPPNLRSCS